MNKNQDEIKTQTPKPIKKLKPLKPVNTSEKPVVNKENSAKKRIVIKYDDVEKIPEEKPVKKEDKKSDIKKSEKKKSDKQKSDNKKTDKQKPEKKGFFESIKEMMYASADEEESETESADIPEEKNDKSNFTVEAIEEDTTANTLETIDEKLPTDEPEEEIKEESKSEKISEQVKEPEKKNDNNHGKKKKNNKKKSQQKNNSVENKKPEDIPEEKPVETKPENVPETETIEESQPTESETTETETDIQNPVETPEEVSTVTAPVHSGKYNILSLVCIILAIIGVIAIINACISGGGSSDDKYRKAIYPAVITDINEFENPSELPVSQILSTAVWSVIIDSEKLSAYPQRVDDMAIIPAEDIEKYAVEIFGEDIPTLTHSTIVTSDLKFYYNEEANSYTVEISPHTLGYSPEILSVSRKSGKYIIQVNYIDQHPEWIEDTISKTVEYTLSKNDNDGYTIESMHKTIAE